MSSCLSEGHITVFGGLLVLSRLGLTYIWKGGGAQPVAMPSSEPRGECAVTAGYSGINVFYL